MRVARRVVNVAIMIALCLGAAAPPARATFPGENGIDVVLLDGDVAEGEVVAVTLERAGGAEKPSLPPVVTSDPV